ncbi:MULTISPECIES: DNA-binding domain-containing protein [Kordiimonas]|uniref:HvfC/BufC N-terminal domain-containing protein n=1 Tax=Kordiimonas TaxID=288021 RepID=UPI00257BD1BE|nr:DNA-binding domain-containing protein [Kordiimonas sp. UBA4487]
MGDLGDIQRSMARTILGQEADDSLLGAIKDDHLGPAARLRIHQNNFRESLSEALLGIFPLCQALVGELFLRQALRHFVLEYPPVDAALYAYGRDVADFFGIYSAAKSVPYLADVARLEWYTHELANAEEAVVYEDITAAQAAHEAGMDFALHDNARVLDSNFPIYDLWQALSGQITPDDLNIEDDGQTILLVLHGGQVFYQLLDAETAGTLAKLSGDQKDITIGSAMLEELIDRGAIKPK